MKHTYKARIVFVFKDGRDLQVYCSDEKVIEQVKELVNRAVADSIYERHQEIVSAETLKAEGALTQKSLITFKEPDGFFAQVDGRHVMAVLVIPLKDSEDQDPNRNLM